MCMGMYHMINVGSFFSRQEAVDAWNAMQDTSKLAAQVAHMRAGLERLRSTAMCSDVLDMIDKALRGE
jgi:hypothetical protein